MEGLQEYFQEVIQNVNTGKPAFENAFKSGLIGTILGIPMGGISGVSFNNLSTTEQQKIIDRELIKKIQDIRVPVGATIKDISQDKGEPKRLWKKPETTPKELEPLAQEARKKISNAFMYTPEGQKWNIFEYRSLTGETWVYHTTMTPEKIIKEGFKKGTKIIKGKIDDNTTNPDFIQGYLSDQKPTFGAGKGVAVRVKKSNIIWNEFDKAELSII